MLRKSMKLFREISTMIPRFRSLEEQCADTQIELRQLMTLLSLTTEIRAIPPKHLQIRVAGVYKARFFESGRNLINDMEDFLQENGESLFKANDILDFGCGCGRMLIPLSFMISPSKIVGTDIDKQSIGWLKSNYAPFKALDVNKIKPPTKYANATFDLVYGVSVFTHLPEDMQHAWLREMSRIMKPGGLGLFTTHGEKFYSKLAGSALREFTDRGFYYSVGKVTEGLPEFYQTSFQSHDYIYREWTKHFDVVAIRREGAKQQDAVLVRNRSKS
jgi:2-polyprenyl-3-methyl-5-hydroxy-6-metoxy-1,4-benzoquinol methylase